ncbi:hypothetical protein KUTeg_006715 [Tegillarca granosa]|uniref:Uncharacterized protein n=1 Tax=Tegillarca granosa TaxID=220873 RepID=A0ABQ9E9Y3_TEGGR|nr:hypothetical protein KUTeg_021156 [Tegillarca granosa]KAJ8310850.1 hypothetical protein KUTeg_012715 [Tegillarca granosa]KAJ8314565.1 hypothetical protein KUTeg_006715 [Tegillarca granosa]
MAEPEANKCGYWQDIKLRYADGQELKVRLDMPTIRKLENGDTALMEEIRRTYVSLPEPSMTCTNGNDSVETQSNREESRASELDETQKIEEILCKRHDIYPTQLAGTGMGSNKEKFFSTKNKYDQDNGPSTSGDKDNGPSTSGDKDDGPSTSGDKDDGPSTSGAKDECPSTNDEGPSKRLSNSKCAAAKRAKREKIRQEQNTGDRLI